MSGLISKHSKFNGVRNFYSKRIDEAIENPVIIHYLSGFYNRPWNLGSSHPMKDRYLFYKSKQNGKTIN